jgi:hypothetical protein
MIEKEAQREREREREKRGKKPHWAYRGWIEQTAQPWADQTPSLTWWWPRTRRDPRCSNKKPRKLWEQGRRRRRRRSTFLDEQVHEKRQRFLGEGEQCRRQRRECWKPRGVGKKGGDNWGRRASDGGAKTVRREATRGEGEGNVPVYWNLNTTARSGYVCGYIHATYTTNVTASSSGYVCMYVVYTWYGP